MTAAPDLDTRTPGQRARGLAKAAAVYFVIGYHVLEAVRAVIGAVRALDEEDGAPVVDAVIVDGIDEDALRRELRDLGGLEGATVETIIAAAKAPPPGS